MGDEGAAAPVRAASIVLAGGRGSRLGGASKPLVQVRGRPMLASVVDALVAASRSRVVIVGPAGEAREALADLGADVLDRVVLALETERYGGPAVAAAAGSAALADAGVAESAAVDLLACDLVHPDRAVAALDAPAVPGGQDGVVLVDGDDRVQWLAGRYRFAALYGALRGAQAGDSLRRVLGALDLEHRIAPAGATRDLDTPADLAAVGAVVQVGTGPHCC